MFWYWSTKREKGAFFRSQAAKRWTLTSALSHFQDHTWWTTPHSKGPVAGRKVNHHLCSKTIILSWNGSTGMSPFRVRSGGPTPNWIGLLWPKWSLYMHDANWLLWGICVMKARTQSSNGNMRKASCTSTTVGGSIFLLDSATLFSPPSLPPSSLASLQRSQQYCRETCQPLWSQHQGREERGGRYKRERASTERQITIQQDIRADVSNSLTFRTVPFLILPLPLGPWHWFTRGCGIHTHTHPINQPTHTHKQTNKKLPNCLMQGFCAVS